MGRKKVDDSNGVKKVDGEKEGGDMECIDKRWVIYIKRKRMIETQHKDNESTETFA